MLVLKRLVDDSRSPSGDPFVKLAIKDLNDAKIALYKYKQ